LKKKVWSFKIEGLPAAGNCGRNMEKKKCKWVAGGVAAGALAMLTGLAIGVTLGVSVDVSQKAAWWEIMTVLGTVGVTTSAVGIAVWNRFSHTQNAKAAADRYARSKPSKSQMPTVNVGRM
jgi:hypothetical protein